VEEVSFIELKIAGYLVRRNANVENQERSSSRQEYINIKERVIYTLFFFQQKIE
jgi:hypothetical protein